MIIALKNLYYSLPYFVTISLPVIETITVPKGSTFRDITWNVAGKMWRGIVHKVSGCPLHFMFYRGNLYCFSNRVYWCTLYSILLFVWWVLKIQPLHSQLSKVVILAFMWVESSNQQYKYNWSRFTHPRKQQIFLKPRSN